MQSNEPGFTAFSHPDSQRPGDRDVVFFRPTVFGDPVRPAAGIGAMELWRSDEVTLDRFEDWLALLPDGLVVGAPSRVEIGGRDAVFFEVEVADEFECGREGFCAGFLINTITSDRVTGWTFERGTHQRVWVVDGGDHQPLAIIAATPVDDRSFEATADDVLTTLRIGDPEPHPADPADWGTTS